MDQLQALVAERFLPALDALINAFDYAEDCRSDHWQFAISLAELESDGATLADLRWLIFRGFAEHALETTIPGDVKRSFRKLAPTAFPADTCFILSSTGASDLTKALRALKHATAPISSATNFARTSKAELLPDSDVTPDWDPVRRELRYRGRVIKRYRVPARNQELVLTVFQESGWPEFIDDPLPPAPERDSKERLQVTIKSLNRNQLLSAIRFHGNGNGQQIYWQAATQKRSSKSRPAIRK